MEKHFFVSEGPRLIIVQVGNEEWGMDCLSLARKEEINHNETNAENYDKCIKTQLLIVQFYVSIIFRTTFLK